MTHNKPKLKRRQSKKRKRKPKRVGRPPLSETTELTPKMEMFCEMVASGKPLAEVRKSLDLSEYLARRWSRDVPLIQERITELVDESQSAVALSYLEKHLAPYGGSSELWLLTHAIELKNALHQHMIQKIGKGEISWNHCLELVRCTEEKFGLFPSKERQTKEIEITTLDLLRSLPNGEEMIRSLELEPTKVTKQVVRESREDL